MWQFGDELRCKGEPQKAACKSHHVALNSSCLAYKSHQESCIDTLCVERSTLRPDRVCRGDPWALARLETPY